jgi:hypothetical protein
MTSSLGKDCPFTSEILLHYYEQDCYRLLYKLIHLPNKYDNMRYDKVSSN